MVVIIIERWLFFIVFFTLALLNQSKLIEITDSQIFALTIGPLIISISTCFSFSTSKELKWINIKWIKKLYNEKYSVLSKGIYAIGFSTMFIFLFLKEDTFISDLMNHFSSTTLMLLAIAVTFLSISISDNNSNRNMKKVEKLTEEKKLMYDKLCEYEVLVDQLLEKVRDGGVS